MLTEGQRKKRDEIVTEALTKIESLIEKEPYASETVYVSKLQELISVVRELSLL